MCVSFLLICGQLLKNLHFHPKLGIITRTISGAASDLVFFFVLMVMVIMLFALLGVMIFGEFSEAFSSSMTSFETCFKILIQMYDPSNDLRDAPDKTLANLFLWGYYIIAFFVLLNALLAIIVESYDRTKVKLHLTKYI